MTSSCMATIIPAAPNTVQRTCDPAVGDQVGITSGSRGGGGSLGLGPGAWRHPWSQGGRGTLVSLGDPGCVDPKRGGAAAGVSEPAGDGPNVGAGRDQLGRAVVAQGVQV